MKIALIGLPQVGKKTLFSLLTGVAYDQLVSRPSDYAVGMVKVTDPRIDKLSALYKPKKTKYAEIECTLAPAPPKEAKPREQWLGKLKDMDAFCHVVRAFEDEAVFHAERLGRSAPRHRGDDPRAGHHRPQPRRACGSSASRRNRRRRPIRERVEEAALLQTLKPYLESGKSLRDHPMEEVELKKIRSLQFLTLKSMVTALNCGESNFPIRTCSSPLGENDGGPGSEAVRSVRKARGGSRADRRSRRARRVSGRRSAIEEPAVHVLTRLLYKALGYICFFTVGEDEVRAWTIRRGGTAVDAAHAIHSDLARGFIRAEVMKCDDLLAAGAERGSGHAAEVHLKETAKLHLKGKDYIVEDGDIVHVRHSG